MGEISCVMMMTVTRDLFDNITCSMNTFSLFSRMSDHLNISCAQ